MTEVLRVLLRAALFYFIYLHHSKVQLNRKSDSLISAFEDNVSNPSSADNSTTTNRNTTASASSNNDDCASDSTCGSNRKKRYILYEVNPGEGFNLRRDIYIRIAPLIKSLNRDDPLNRTWVLVLPPWGRLPHWRKTNYTELFPWSRFFDFESILKYIPVLELHKYNKVYGKSNDIDVVYQLQHFPLDDPTEWRERIITPVKCRESLAYKLSYKTKSFTGYFWNTKMAAKTAQCMSLRGQASTLRDFLFNSTDKAIMFDRAEVILWDHYGGEDWWKARLSLKFSSHLYEVAYQFLRQNNLEPSPYKSTNELRRKDVYIGVHLRRRDFLYGRGDRLPTIQSVASQLIKLSFKLQIHIIFLATDSEPLELQLLQHLLRDHIRLITVASSKCSMTEGECAITDQILCSFAAYFVGTEDSTFTFRIFEEREIIGFQPELTYNYLCSSEENKTSGSSETKCKQPTKWRMPLSLMQESRIQ